MKIAVLIASRNRPDLVEALTQQLARSMTLPHDVYVVECGTDRDKLSPHSNLWYADPEFRGKCFGHNLALQAAQIAGRYDYYFVLMNDVVFEPGVDPARALIDQLEREPRMALLSPTDVDGGYPGAERRGRDGWRAVTTCDYLGFMLRASAVDEVGFLNPEFKYCWGAIHELSYKLYSHGWFVAYSDEVTYKHLGGSTYGQKGTQTISREEYQQRAKRFAFDYFRRHYGDNWDELFWAAAQGHGIERDTFAEHKRLWSSAYTAEELRELGCERARNALPLAARMTPELAPGAFKLHLGCGPEKRAGWFNVDTNPAVEPDLVSSVDALPSIADRTVDCIEANHLFEHLTHDQAHSALAEWARVLKPGGELYLELPDFDACVRMLGRYKDERGFDLGMIGIYGWPPAIAAEGLPQVHKWGWTRATLVAALQRAGFERVEFGPITQTWRVAAKVGRDLRLRAVRAGARVETRAAEPEGLAFTTAAPVRVFAWPDWNDATEIGLLLNGYGRHMVGRSDVCLCLRRDPRLDPGEAEVLAALQAAHARMLGADAPIEALIVDDVLAPADWPRLERSISCAIALPSSKSGARASLYAALGRKVVHTIEAFDAHLPGAPAAAASEAAAPSYSRAVLDTVDWELVGKIKELHPWFYPVVLGNLKVAPGVGSHVAPEFLERRTACRATLLVDEVARRVELAGKSVLELACNCAYWSSRYAQLGATRVVGLEGRESYVRQAQLYWSTNGFLPRDAYEFLPGNISDEGDWKQLRERGPFDVTLCAGILYHVPNYREILRWAAELTRDVLIVDTRVDDVEETPIEEPGELHFNAIAETRVKVVPNRARLLACLRELGFAPEVLPVGFAAGLGVDDVDNYAAGRRVTILARRVRVGANVGNRDGASRSTSG